MSKDLVCKVHFIIKKSKILCKSIVRENVEIINVVSGMILRGFTPRSRSYCKRSIKV